MSILVLASDTLIGTAAAGNIEYNGQFYGTDSAASRAQLQRITQGTAVASTSGTSIDFTSLPAWVKRITVMFNGVSTNSTSNIIIQIGSGSVTTSGYTSLAQYPSTPTTFTSGFGIVNSINNASTVSGISQICLLGSNIYIQNGNMITASGVTFVSAGNSSALSGALDRIRITTVNGTDAFDAGSINIMYEG
jgi:hypothetical protein